MPQILHAWLRPLAWSGPHGVSNGQSHFKENSVFTVEPGIYLPEEGFGVRLEDNVQITTSGPLNLTSRIPIEAEEIEEIMNR